MTELDELKQKWAEHDRKLELNVRRPPTPKRDKNESGEVRIAAPGLFPGMGVAIALAVIIPLGSFIGDHIAMVRFVIPAAVLHLFEIATLIVLIQQIRLASHRL